MQSVTLWCDWNVQWTNTKCSNKQCRSKSSLRFEHAHAVMSPHIVLYFALKQGTECIKHWKPQGFLSGEGKALPHEEGPTNCMLCVLKETTTMMMNSALPSFSPSLSVLLSLFLAGLSVQWRLKRRWSWSGLNRPKYSVWGTTPSQRLRWLSEVTQGFEGREREEVEERKMCVCAWWRGVWANLNICYYYCSHEWRNFKWGKQEGKTTDNEQNAEWWGEKLQCWLLTLPCTVCGGRGVTVTKRQRLIVLHIHHTDITHTHTHTRVSFKWTYRRTSWAYLQIIPV